ncbi:MAG: DUF2231 domain-containing protein [Acidobacteria bacterium]|nr:DUF2231 domain-containing protein [Acidobacteriota bacterium]
MNPFDLEAALLAKHAQHVVLIHFPIALLLTGVAFDAASQWTRQQALAAAAYYNLSVAALSALPAVVTGLLAWQWQLGGHRPRGTLLLHLVLGASASALIGSVWWIHQRARRAPGQPLPAWRWPLELLAVSLVTLTGHLGGFLSGVNALG